ncbi:MAG: hypothetical protein HOY71_45750, partial [Nonomuraea sp.]|nr:hypothetical protein [Nonomuraea sp.]
MLAARRARRMWPLLVVGWVVQLAVRLWLSRYHVAPVANPDESGYLLAARWLSGGAGGDFSGSTFYQGGYPLLLVPAFWLAATPEAAYRLVVVIGSAVSAGVFPLAYLALRRLGVSWRAGLGLAFAAALGPAVTEFSGLALTDAVLPTLVLAWLLAIHDLAAYGSPRAAVLAGALSGFASTVHMRGYVLLSVFAATSLLILLRFRRQRNVRRVVVIGLVVAGVVAGAGVALNAVLKTQLYPHGARDLSGLLVERLTTLDGQAWALAGAVGQLWYLIVATWGLAGLGLAAAVVAAVRGRGPVSVVAAALVLATAGIAYASSAALPDEHRVGNFAYGRYTACVATAWVIAGLVVLLRRRALLRHTLAATGLLAATAATVAWYAGDRLATHVFIAFDFPEVMFLSGARDHLDLLTTSAAALLLLLAAVAAARWG